MASFSCIGAALVLLVVIVKDASCGRLTIEGNRFLMDGERVFLSGTNEAWVNYGFDFGNDQYKDVQATFEQSLSAMHDAGGNSVRIWVHIEGQSSPSFDADGFVDGTDASSTLISDLRSYLQAAAANDILIFITLWNGAAVNDDHHAKLDGLVKDTDKLQSYIDNCLIPMVEALKDEPGLGGWDIINEPAGIMIPGTSSDNPCEDTTALSDSGMGWEGEFYTALEMQRFMNLQIDAIRTTDPEALVSVGIWNSMANTDAFGFHDLYKDDCLVAAGGKANGVTNFYQIHTYASRETGTWDGYSPFEHDYADFMVDGGKPLVIGEFFAVAYTGDPIDTLYDWAYTHNYAGAWSWSVTDAGLDAVTKELRTLDGRDDQDGGGKVNFSV